MSQIVYREVIVKFWITLLFLVAISTVHAVPPSIYKVSVKGDFDNVYKHVYSALENNRMFVVLEPDIGARMANFAKRWGDDYNKNKLERIKSMVFCNIWYVNQVSNADPDMVAMCPLHITLTHKQGITSVVFLRPDVLAKGSGAEDIAKQLADHVIKAINEGIENSKGNKVGGEK